MNNLTPGSPVYILMPFDAESNWIYEMSVRPACEDVGFPYERVDPGVFADDVEESLLEDAQRRIKSALVVITDMTIQAPALFYLTGYAYTLSKKVIPLVLDRQLLPAGFRGRWPLVYSELGADFTRRLEWRIRRAVEPPNMEQRMRRNSEARQSESDTTGKNAAVAEPDKVFISYSRSNEWWLNKLKIMCAPMVSNRKMEVWDDTRIASGERWRPAIESAIRKSKVAVLMVSPDFLASEFIMNNELPYLLKAAARGKLKVLWVLLSACLYQETDIPSYQAAHDISKPLAALSTAKRDEALRDICLRIAETLKPRG